MHVTGSDGVKIVFETVGSGLPLVLLHGFSETAPRGGRPAMSTLSPAVIALSSSMPVVTVEAMHPTTWTATGSTVKSRTSPSYSMS